MQIIKNISIWIVQIVLALLLISFITFLLTNISADDPIVMKFQHLGASLDAELLKSLRTEAGLDKPFFERYMNWLLAVLEGDLGTSIFYGLPVWSLMVDALPKTLALVFMSLGMATIIALPLSILSATHRNSLVDILVRIFSLVSISLPSFWVGLILLYIFALQLQLVTVTNTSGIAGLVLPALTLAIWIAGLYIRRLRAALLEELGKDYVIGAKALGLSKRTIIYSYVLPNVGITILPMLGITIGSLLGGATIIETIFGWQGIGYLMVQGITTRDYPLMQGYILWAASMYLFLNTFMELLVNYLMPQRHMKAGV